MTQTERVILTIYAVIVIAWPVRHVAITIIFGMFDFLTLRSPRYTAPDPPLVTAIIPAKDEEESLPECLRSVCAQSYPNLEILVVNDRSTDRTAAVAEAIAADDQRARVVTIETLPPGWTGKTHALHVASEQARGDWFWFLDADTRHHPDSLSIVMEYAREQGAALASLVPEMRCETFWERVVQPLSGIVLMRSFPLYAVNDDRKKLAFANGQYILIRKDTYAKCGGHVTVRDRFVEDIYLAKAVKAQGDPIRAAMGTEISSTRMYTSLPQIVRGWSRIMWDSMGRNPWPLVGKILEPLIFSQTFLIAIAIGLLSWGLHGWGPFSAWMLGLAAVHLILQITVLYRMYLVSSPKTAIDAIWYPLAGFISDWILLKSIWMCLTGRVTWRGTSYSPTPVKGPASRS